MRCNWLKSWVLLFVYQRYAHSTTSFASIEQFIEDIRALQAANATPPCEARLYGDGSNGHALCPALVTRECSYVSYGVHFDWSFDRDVTGLLNCTGSALDPTVDHPVSPMPGVLFIKLGATMLTSTPFPVKSIPWLIRWFGHRRLFALKVDCEGCEYALAPAVDAEFPHMFTHIDQLNIELHVHSSFLSSAAELDNLDRLLTQLRAARLHLAHVDPTSCGRGSDCAPELERLGFPCTMDCASFLFARRAKGVRLN